MRMLAEFYPEFTEKLDEIDENYKEKMPFDEKTYQLICFALSVKERNAPGAKQHFREALTAGATIKEMSYTLALVMRGSADADDCWTHEALGDWTELLKEDFTCSCNCDHSSKK